MIRLAIVSVLGAFVLTACPEDIENPLIVQGVEVGGPCSANIECESLLCSGGVCIAENQPPVADAGGSRVTLVGVPVTLSGSESADPDAGDGETLTFRWDLITRPADSDPTFLGQETATPTLTPDATGVYEVELTVTDADGAEAKSTASVFVLNQEGNYDYTLPDGSACDEGPQCKSGKCEDNTCAFNNIPVANAGVSRMVPVGEEVVLDGSGSNDPDGEALSFHWELLQLPEGSVTLLDNDAAVGPRFVADVPGLFVVRLTVNDGFIGSIPATIGILSSDDAGQLRPDDEPCTADAECISQFCFEGACKTNEAPVAEGGAGQLVQVGTTVTLDGSNSYDPEQLPLTYTWAVNDAPEGSAATISDPAAVSPEFTPDIEGIYLVRLVVNDGQLDSLPADFVIVAQPEPVVLLQDGETCGADLECESTFCNASVCEVNDAPIADAGTSQELLLGQTATLDGSGSSDPEGFAITYAWAFVETPDGSTVALSDPSATQPTFTPDLAGIYAVQLVVNDGDLDSTPDSVAVVAVAPEGTGKDVGEDCTGDNECNSDFCNSNLCEVNDPPVADAGASQSLEVGQVAMLDSSASNDPEGYALGYSWTLLEAPAGSTAALSDATAASPTLTPDVAGIYSVQLVVDDGALFSVPSTVAVVATAPENPGLPDGDSCTDGVDCNSGYCNTSNLCEVDDPPVAEAGTSQLLEPGDTAALDGSGSSDPEGQALTYSWAFIEKPATSTATLSDAAAVAPTFTLDVEGIYTLQLVVNDGGQSSVPDTVAVVAATSGGLGKVGDPCGADEDCTTGFCNASGSCAVNTPPVADAGTSATAYVTLPVTLVGNGTDAENQPLTYAWTLEEWPAGSSATVDAPTSATTSFTPDVEGLYRLSLVVFDGYDVSAPSFVTYLALGGGLPDGSPCTADSDCVSGFCPVSTSTCTTNQPPVAVTVTPVNVTVGATATLDGSGSSDTDGTITAYAWTLTSAPAGSAAAIVNADQAVASITPDVNGDYVARLIVDDGYDLSSAGFVLVKAQASPGALPDGAPCSSNAECSSSFCSPVTSTCQCLPASCVELGAECGTVDNGCGDPLDCGGCSSGNICNLLTNTCDCNPQTCADQGYECGSWTDGCGNALDCGGCDVVANGTGVCNAGGTCDIACDANFHACGLECLADASPASCGTSCTPCPEPTSGNGFATCSAGSCGLLCDSGFEACNGDCIDPLTDKNNCGGCGVEVCDDECVAGSCENPLTIEIISGDNQTVSLNQEAPNTLRVRVFDINNVPQEGLQIVVTPSPGAWANPGITDVAGVADILIWSGRQPGAYTFDLAAGPLSNPASATLNAQDVAVGEVYPLVNTVGTTTGNYVLGAGSHAWTYGFGLGGVAVASDGTIYMSGDSISYGVFALSPDGEVTRVIGGIGSGNTGDGGPALNARIASPQGLALDEANNLLYVVDRNHNRIRLVDLDTGIIQHYAGGGSSSGNAGDGGPITSAGLGYPGRLHLGPDGKLYLMDNGRIRVIDPVTGLIDHYVGALVEGCGGEPTIIDCGFGSFQQACAMSWSTSGDAFVTGPLCGQGVPTNTWGVIRIAPDGTRSRVAGSQLGSVALDIPALAHRFSATPYEVQVDSAENLLVVDGNAIKRIDRVTSVITLVAGTLGSSGSSGDHGAAADALFGNPRDLAVGPDGDIFVLDASTRMVRGLRGFNTSPSQNMTLTKVGGDNTTTTLGMLYDPLSVELSDGSGGNYIGQVIEWESNQPGTTPQSTTLPTALPLGYSTLIGRVGIELEPQTFTASLRDIYGDHVPGSPATFTVTPEPPEDGHVFTMFNVDKAGASAYTQTPAIVGRAQVLRGMDVASDGTLYFVDELLRRVMVIRPDGSFESVAGNGSGSFSGDGGPASSAGIFSPQDVALDEANGLLYIGARNRVRLMDLNSGLITTFAGGGTQSVNPYGDGGSALDATFSNINAVSLSPDGQVLYIAEVGRTRLWKIEGGIITSIFKGDDPASCTGTPIRFASSTQSCDADHCNIIVDPATGDLYMTAFWCGNDWLLGTNARYGVIRIPAGTGTPEAFLGANNTGVVGNGSPALNTIVSPIHDIALGVDGTFYFTEGGASDTIRYIDSGGLVQTFAGDGTSGVGVDYVPALNTQFDDPDFLLAHPDGHLIIADVANDAIRWVWSACSDDADCTTTGFCDPVYNACMNP